MKLEKYFFFLPEANRLASIRANCRCLTMSELTTLYILKLYSPIKYEAIMRKLRSYYHHMGRQTLSTALVYLQDSLLIERSQVGYSISPLGREYLSYVRRYMLNRRL